MVGALAADPGRLVQCGVGFFDQFPRQRLFRSFPIFDPTAGQPAGRAPKRIGDQEHLVVRCESEGICAIRPYIHIT